MLRGAIISTNLTEKRDDCHDLPDAARMVFNTQRTHELNGPIACFTGSISGLSGFETSESGAYSTSETRQNHRGAVQNTLPNLSVLQVLHLRRESALSGARYGSVRAGSLSPNPALREEIDRGAWNRNSGHGVGAWPPWSRFLDSAVILRGDRREPTPRARALSAAPRADR